MELRAKQYDHEATTEKESDSMKQLGIRFNPPSLILLYKYNEHKFHQRIMPIRNFNTGSSVRFFASQLVLRHEEHLQSIPLIAIEKMLTILLEHMKGLSLQEILEKIKSDFEVNPEEDLNKLPDEQLQRKKLIMEASFVANQLPPTHPDFEYDRQVDFETIKIESGWDVENHTTETEDGDDFWG